MHVCCDPSGACLFVSYAAPLSADWRDAPLRCPQNVCCYACQRARGAECLLGSGWPRIGQFYMLHQGLPLFPKEDAATQ